MRRRGEEDFSTLSCYRSRSKSVQVPVNSEILGLMVNWKENRYLAYNFNCQKRVVTESQKANGKLEATEERSHQFHSCFFCYHFPFTEVLFTF